MARLVFELWDSSKYARSFWVCGRVFQRRAKQGDMHQPRPETTYMCFSYMTLQSCLTVSGDHGVFGFDKHNTAFW
ncbi:hypothetical protein ACRALDRAFT_1061176 [Sodiomyces alcalophilus JCM 7366]|uniref:uncharacterized protein n=1 Tax=Sodiomyces alcalophilus JCM 7366 TaxID=591952 RepID=UPI0039B53C6C